MNWIEKLWKLCQPPAVGPPVPAPSADPFKTNAVAVYRRSLERRLVKEKDLTIGYVSSLSLDQLENLSHPPLAAG